MTYFDISLTFVATEWTNATQDSIVQPLHRVCKRFVAEVIWCKNKKAVIRMRLAGESVQPSSMTSTAASFVAALTNELEHPDDVVWWSSIKLSENQNDIVVAETADDIADRILGHVKKLEEETAEVEY